MPLNTADIYIVLFFHRVRRCNIFTFLWGSMLSGVMKSDVKLKVKLFVNRLVFIGSMHFKVIFFTSRIH